MRGPTAVRKNYPHTPPLPLAQLLPAATQGDRATARLAEADEIGPCERTTPLAVRALGLAQEACLGHLDRRSCGRRRRNITVLPALGYARSCTVVTPFWLAQ
jgi:hypothetical protein